MIEYKEFENWWGCFISSWVSSMPDIAEFYALLGWQACTELKDKVIEQQAAELKALSELVRWLYESGKEHKELGNNNYYHYALRKFNLIDENGNPTPLLTGEDGE